MSSMFDEADIAISIDDLEFAEREARGERRGWILAADRLPRYGQRIVCEFSQGTVWAGYYTGVKQSFKYWRPI